MKAHYPPISIQPIYSGRVSVDEEIIIIPDVLFGPLNLWQMGPVAGTTDIQLLPPVIIIRQSTRQRSLVWSFRLHWSSFEYPDLVLQEVSGLIVIRDQSTKEKRERCAHNWTITKVLKIWAQCRMLDDSIASTPSDLWFRSRPVIIIIKLKAVHRKNYFFSWCAIGKRMNEFSKEFSGVLHSEPLSKYLKEMDTSYMYVQVTSHWHLTLITFMVLC